MKGETRVPKFNLPVFNAGISAETFVNHERFVAQHPSAQFPTALREDSLPTTP